MARRETRLGRAPRPRGRVLAYLHNSARLQQLGHKYQIERARADNRVSGYDYWLLVDYPGGTGEGDSWEEGWLDYFWRPKTAPEEGRAWNSPVLLLIDSHVDDRSLWTDESKPVEVSVSNYGPAADPRWRALLVPDGGRATRRRRRTARTLGAARRRVQPRPYRA